jgi:hypothetical protein
MWEAIAVVVAGLISGLIGPILLYRYKESRKENDSSGDQTVNEEVRFAQDLNKEIDKIREEVEADRIWIAQFHNGGKLLSSIRNTSMKRISVTHEAVGAGVSREQNTFSGMLVTFFSDMIGRLLNKDYINYTGDIANSDPEIELLFRQRGTEEMHLLAMRNIEGVLIGILGVDYVDDPRNLSEEEVQYLIAKASLLAGYIFYGNIQKQTNKKDE